MACDRACAVINRNLNGEVQDFEDTRRWNVWFRRQGHQHSVQGRGSHQENEEEVLLLGGVHGSQRDQVSPQTKPPLDRQAKGGHSRQR